MPPAVDGLIVVLWRAGLRIDEALALQRLVSELALDDDERHAFAGHLDHVGVPQLVRREASANAGSRRGASELSACPAGGPRPHSR